MNVPPARAPAPQHRGAAIPTHRRRYAPASQRHRDAIIALRRLHRKEIAFALLEPVALAPPEVRRSVAVKRVSRKGIGDLGQRERRARAAEQPQPTFISTPPPSPRRACQPAADAFFLHGNRPLLARRHQNRDRATLIGAPFVALEALVARGVGVVHRDDRAWPVHRKGNFLIGRRAPSRHLYPLTRAVT